MGLGTEKSMWAGPTQKKKKMDHYMLCLSYPQTQEGQISYLHILLIMGQEI